MQKKLAEGPEFLSRFTRTALLALMLLGASGFFLSGPVFAQVDATPPDTTVTETPLATPGLPAESESDDASNRILSISVNGLDKVDTTLVLSTFQVRKGDIYRIQAIRDGIRALNRLSLFETVEVDGERTPEGINLSIDVVESPRISAVEFRGNDGIDSDKLQETITGTTGKVANARTLNDVVVKIRALYEEEGYPLAKIEGSYVQAEKANERLLSLDINEGSKVQVTAIHFEGNEHLSDDDLRGEMETKQKSFWKKGHLRPEKLEEDLDKIRTYYQRKGFRDVRIVSHDVAYAPDNRTAEVRIVVEEGPIYTMGEPSVVGNVLFPTPVLQGLIKFKAGDRYNRQKIDESAGEIGGVYADRGYLYAQVDPEEQLDSTTVLVTYMIVEQEPSKVRQIQIAGNTRTKERVIRRQLHLFPGKRFDRSLLIRSQRELFQLGFFQDVQVDFRPLPNSYDVDLILNVQEKPVGTASAGAGFSSQGGLTGFVELGHPNLFGNGQSVNLRMEKGSRTSNFEFSFTEPWFLDSPTTLGIDIFRTTLIRDIYELKRTGGAIRAARPVPGLPYTRAFGSYSFEKNDGFGRLTINEFPDTLFSADKDTLVINQQTSHFDPIQIDPSSRNTSSITLGLTRNSTDHPVYPRTGMSSVFTSEFAGGLLQGDVSFQKYVFDNRLYLKALDFPKNKSAFLVRTQLGGVGFFGGEDPIRVPFPDSLAAIKDPEDRLFRTEALELFRLGGTQGQALRGYDDYEVVPEENVRERIVTTYHTVIENGIINEEKSDTTVTTVYDTFPGGRYYAILALERQFTIAEPLHGVIFGEAGGTWNKLSDFSFGDLRKSLGFGVRMEIPLLGQVGFDYAYGFNRLNRDDPDPTRRGRYNKGGWQPHLHFGRFF